MVGLQRRTRVDQSGSWQSAKWCPWVVQLSPNSITLWIVDQVADLDADLRLHIVCVSQAGRKLVESQLRTGLRTGSSYVDMSDSWNQSATCFRSKKSRELVADLHKLVRNLVGNLSAT